MACVELGSSGSTACPVLSISGRTEASTRYMVRAAWAMGVGGALKALSGGSKHPPRSVMPPGALVLPLLSSGRTLDGSLCPQIPLLSSQIPPQPRRAAPTTPPPPVKRRDRDALVVSGSGEKAGMGSWGHPVLRMVARPMSENWGLLAWG